MKRIAALLIALCMVFSLCACSRSNTYDEAHTTTYPNDVEVTEHHVTGKVDGKPVDETYITVEAPFETVYEKLEDGQQHTAELYIQNESEDAAIYGIALVPYGTELVWDDFTVFELQPGYEYGPVDFVYDADHLEWRCALLMSEDGEYASYTLDITYMPADKLVFHYVTDDDFSVTP